MDVGERSSGSVLEQWLAARDAMCPGCGYNVRGLTGAQCPECGRGLELGLTARPPLTRAVRRGIVGFAVLGTIASLVRSAFNAFWFWRYYAMMSGAGAAMGYPPYYWVRMGGEVVVNLVLAGIIGAGLVGLRGGAADVDGRYLRCLRLTVVGVGVQMVWEIALYCLYVLT